MASPQIQTPPPASRAGGFRLACWNILEGFHHPGTAEVDETRLSAARVVLEQLDPEVLVLNEALWCQHHGGRRVDYAALLGFPEQVSELYDGHWGNVILSRRPILSHGIYAIYNRGGVVAEIGLADGRSVSVATYHPHPGRYPSNKADDFVALSNAARGRALALCGDFNAISPEDRPDRRALIEAFGRFSSRPEHDVDRFLLGGEAVFPALARLGLRDAIPPAGRRATMPTDLVSPDKRSGMRIDHLMVSEELECLWGEVVRHPSTELASDHYPLVADLVLTERRPTE